MDLATIKQIIRDSAKPVSYWKDKIATSDIPVEWKQEIERELLNQIKPEVSVVHDVPNLWQCIL